MNTEQSKEEYAAPIVIKHDALKEITGGVSYHTYRCDSDIVWNQ